MDPATEVRADLRNYALRRCIRFYSAVLLAGLHAAAAHLVERPGAQESLAGAMAVLFGILAAVEVASGLVMLQMARVRDAHPGPETPLWRLAQGPHPSWLAAAGFAAWALFLAVAIGPAL